jgi:membrane fusion protein (multidrug efflux system)
MKKRMGLMLLVVGLFIAAIGAVKFFQIRAAIAQGSAYKPPPETVTSVSATQEVWPGGLTAIGTVKAVHGVTLSADLAGVVDRIDFQSGAHVREGQTLVRLDVATESAQLKQAEAANDLAKINLERAERLIERGVIAQAELDRMRAESRASEASAQAIRAIIGRKTIKAPFSGVLGIRQVDIGERLNEGQPIVELQSLDPVYVDFSVPQQEVGQLKVGDDVRVSADSVTGGSAAGKITAINSVVDAATRNVWVQATFKNTGRRLRPGMFVDVNVELGTSRNVVTLPASAINFAPYGNSVFVIEDIKNPQDPKAPSYQGVTQKFVKLGASRGDQVAVLEGLKPGDQVVSSGVFKLRTGMAVKVDNKIQPSNSPAPKPEDS